MNTIEQEMQRLNKIANLYNKTEGVETRRTAPKASPTHRRGGGYGEGRAQTPNPFLRSGVNRSGYENPGVCKNRARSSLALGIFFSGLFV